ncbi:hypothetical protein ACO0LD_30455 [Undibacterium sp. Ji83W]|uniref:hypothetical protein n=1 Tax=Undibacterium sp. Ji83W TaxID=3413043 RepID=UPI003BF05E5F
MPSVNPVKDKAALKPPVVKSVKSILISLLRQPEGIVALLSDEVDGVVQPVFRQIDLAALHTQDMRLFPSAASLLADWHSLQDATELSSVWPAFWRVFWMTVSDSARASTSATTATAPQVRAVKKPMATAAHPRAYRGTKYQPPKPVQAELDLCRWLADPRLLDVFFAQHDFTVLPVLDAQGLVLPLAADIVPTSAALYFHRWRALAEELPVLPDAFRRNFLWRLRECSADQQLAWLQIWHQHNSLHSDEVSRSEKLVLLARLCAMNTGQTHAAELALLLPEKRQNIFLRVLMREVQGKLSVQQMNADQLIRLQDLTEEDSRFEYYLRSSLANLQRLVSVEYSLAGCLLFEMSGETNLREYMLGAKLDCKDVPVEAIVKACDATGGGPRISLWDYCAELPGLAKLLRETQWEKLNQGAAQTWLNVMYNFMDEDDKDKQQAKWRVYLDVFYVCHDALIALPADRQDKLALMWKNFIDGWGKASSMARAAREFLPLMHKLCLPPFSANIDYGHSFVNIVETWPEDERQEILDLDMRIWLHLERACRRQDEARLIVFGSYTLSEGAPLFLRNSLLHAPSRLFKTLRLLGSLAYERRQSFMRQQMKTDWFALDWHLMPPPDACRRLFSLSKADGLDSPLPRRLRDFLDGRLNLSPSQVSRHCQLTLSRLPSLLLRALEAALWKEIDAPFQLYEYSRPARHALRLLAGLSGGSFANNRKGLRRFLLNARAGNTLDYVDHPLNQQWYAKHPKVRRSLWQMGLQRAGQTAQGKLSLAFELDPFEVLMMGTYAGSCLGVGGLCDYSAVACLLDANKQVLYARNEQGKVIARQLMAIDEEDQLVCFSVYPENVTQELKAAFKSYNEEMSDLLELKLYRLQDGACYDVATILAQDWWDDGSWQDE